MFLCNDDTLQSPKTLNLSPSTLPPPPLPPSSFSSLHKRQNIREMKQESGEAFWDAQRVVDVEHFRHCCCRLLPPLCFPLCLSLSACLSARLSISVLVVRRTWQLASLGCLPPLRVQYVQSTLCQLFYFFLLVLFCLSPFHVVVFFSFFPFFLISAWRLLFDSLCWAKACRWRLEQGGELWLSHFWAHLKDHNVIVHEIVAAPFIVSMPQLKSTAELLQ